MCQNELGRFIAIISGNQQDEDFEIFEILQPPTEDLTIERVDIEITTDSFIKAFLLYWGKEIYGEGFFYDFPQALNNLMIRKPT